MSWWSKPYKVVLDIPVSPDDPRMASFTDFRKARTIFTDIVADQREWLKANAKGRFSMPGHPNKNRIPGSFAMEFAFERQEDAALFKLFWC